MKDFAKHLSTVNSRNCMEVPSMVKTHEFVDDIIHTLFPIKLNCTLNPDQISIELDRCAIKLRELLYSIKNSISGKPQEVATDFFTKIPAAFDELIGDAEAITQFDPASSCIEEVILCYPGFYCISVYRLANILYKLNVPVLPRVMMEYAHSKTGIDIHPGASIDTPFFIDHGTGIVIGETAVIGKNVKIYQGVTIGALSVDKHLANTKRHPTIEDNVIIYAGSTILGGKTVIGHDTVVGGNTWITESILPYSLVYRQHRVIVRDSKGYNEPIDFVI
ncbi:MAG TPA: serine acetyltransferase [Bacteroidaceae bacterium]|nr:serine acetyltransferase [Bacteroidaceae bacterium]